VGWPHDDQVALSLACQIQKERAVKKSEKDRLATRVSIYGARSEWPHGKQTELSFPTILSFASAIRQCTGMTRRDRLVRRDVAVVMNSLLQSLELERK
jgi:hypothetical protein